MPDDLTKQEVRLKQEELKNKKAKLNDLKKELKENKIARRKEKKLQEATLEQKKKNAELLKQQFIVDNKLKKTEGKLDKEKSIVKEKALRDLTKEFSKKNQLIKDKEFNELENLRITKTQKKFYENIVKTEKERQKTKNELEKLEKKEILIKKKLTTGGIIGSMLKEKVKGFVEDLPIVGSLIGLGKEIKKRKETFQTQKATIASGELEEIPITNTTTPTGSGDTIKPIGNGGNSLLEINRQGFQSIVDTLLAIDHGEDIEEEHERRDAERRNEKELPIITKDKKEDTKNSLESIFGKKGKFLANMLAPALGTVMSGLLTVGLPLAIIKGIDVALGKIGLKRGEKEQKELTELVKSTKEKGSIVKGTGIIIEKIDKILPAISYLSEKIADVPLSLIPETKKGTIRKSITGAPVFETQEEYDKYIKKHSKKRQHGGFIGKNGAELFVGGEKGAEFVLDNEATKNFLDASKRIEKIKELEKLKGKFGKDPTQELYEKITMVKGEIASLHDVAKGGGNVMSSIERRRAILEKKLEKSGDKDLTDLVKIMITKLDNINNNMKSNVEISSEISKKTLGNNIVVANGNGNGNNVEPITKLVYENANFSEL